MTKRIVAFLGALIMLRFAASAMGQSAVELVGEGVVSTERNETFAQIISLRLEGRLAEAQTLAEETLDSEEDSFRRVELHLELARIYDRNGLHQNTRPVAEVLEHIELTTESAEVGHDRSRAAIELALADYFYRAEMQAREFPLAARHAQRAIEMFSELGDPHGEADAVHRLGLIEMQRGNLELARGLFDHSLMLDLMAGERVFFRGEYERHVGYVVLLQGDRESAIPFFKRSLAYRIKAGAIDASLFAASTLASSLVELGHLEEAGPVLQYGMEVAERINSPVGKARLGLVEGRLHARAGDEAAARLAYETTIDVAESVNYASVAEQAKKELDAL